MTKVIELVHSIPGKSTFFMTDSVHADNPGGRLGQRGFNGTSNLCEAARHSRMNYADLV